MNAFMGVKTSITAGATRKTPVMFWAFSNGALNVALSSQSNRQLAKPREAFPLRDARIVGCPCCFSSGAMELDTLPVPPSRRMVDLEDIILNIAFEVQLGHIYYSDRFYIGNELSLMILNSFFAPFIARGPTPVSGVS